MKRLLIMIMLATVAAPLGGCVVVPAHPARPAAVWVPGHYNAAGIWIRGHYA
jgi:hypothetical protein